NWVMRNSQAFIPLQFAPAQITVIGNIGYVLPLSMGNLTGAAHAPNDVIPGAGVVTASGSAPARLRIPRHRFVEDAMALVHIASTIDRITTNVGVDAPFAAATLAPDGGPGSFTWCPQDPACVAG